jgi:hypothetical protein
MRFRIILIWNFMKYPSVVLEFRAWGRTDDPRGYQIFWEVVGLERGPLGPVSTTEELLERKSIGSGLENRYYGLGIRDADCATPSIR